MIEIRYFARLREQLGHASEEVPPATELATVGDILDLLRQRGGIWSELFAAGEPVLAAINQDMARPETPVEDGDEVAFFPPVTGG